jgi:subtilisin
VFVVAAGNDGKNASGFVPAAYDDTVITVSATFGDKSGPDDGDTTPDDGWPSWSNFGSVVDIAAPGVSIVSTRLGGGTTTFSGTSMASPHAAGGVALYLARTSQSANYSAYINARSAILSTAEDTSAFSDPTTSASHNEGFLNACAVAGQSGC